MIIYGIIMFAVAAIFGVIAVQIYRGRTDLINDYHQTKVTDKAAYGKAFGKAMGIIAGTLTLSGVISLLSQSVAWLAVAVLFAGLLAGIIVIFRVQKKYNGGIF